jgi:hypothetical protein
MRGKNKDIWRAMVLVALWATPVAATAQPLQDWSLPAPEPDQTGGAAQGPVDAQNPVVRPAEPSPEEVPAPSPVPTIDAPPPPAVTQSPEPEATPSAQPTAQASTTPRPAPSPSAAPAPPVASPRPSPDGRSEPMPLATPIPAASAEDAAPAADLTSPTVREETRWPFWLWAVPAALGILALGILLLLRRRRPAITHEEDEQPDLPIEPDPHAHALPDRAPAPLPLPTFAPDPAGSRMRAKAHLEFESLGMRLSLVFATLQFRVRLTAQTDLPSGRLLADLISAHGSLPQDQQLAPPPDALVQVQTFQPMAAGEVLDIKGELQLPLNTIRPVKQGGASFMVPLVRLALLGDDGPAAPHLELGRVFTVGLPGPGPALAPLRLDTGPREFTGLCAREIEAARRTLLLPLDPARAAG